MEFQVKRDRRADGRMDSYFSDETWSGVYLLAEQAADGAGLALVPSGRGLILTDGKLELLPDLTGNLRRLEDNNLNRELIVRAAAGRGGLSGIRQQEPFPIAVDATAGLGEDSLLLAAAGFRVRLYEANPVIAVLLQDALLRAREHPALKEAASRMELHYGDSIRAMREMASRPHLILLDPMFPARQKSSLVKKKFQLLKHLERPCGNEEELLAAAEEADPLKILIKRPAKGPYLAGRKPSYSIAGKTIRCDCIVSPSRSETF